MGARGDAAAGGGAVIRGGPRSSALGTELPRGRDVTLTGCAGWHRSGEGSLWFTFGEDVIEDAWAVDWDKAIPETNELNNDVATLVTVQP